MPPSPPSPSEPTSPASPAAPGAPGGCEELRVEIRFHGPFRVGTGTPKAGVDAPVDPDDPVPASSLKGLMLASARRLLPGGHPLLPEVFGAGRRPSPWHWGGAVFPQAPRSRPRVRVQIDADTGAVAPEHLFHTEEHWAHTAEFTVFRAAHLPPARAADHLTVLACAAAGVHALGADRRRGLGWVTCTPLAPAVDDALLTRFETLRSHHRA